MLMMCITDNLMMLDNFNNDGVTKVSKKKAKSRSRLKSMAIVACNRCKSRKQKCDGDFQTNTACSNCNGSNKECIYEANKGSQYIKSLELRNQKLQKELDELRSKIPLSNDSDEHLFNINGVSDFGTTSLLLTDAIKELKQGETFDSTETDWAECISLLLNRSELVDNYFDIYIEFVHSKYPMLDISYINYLRSNKDCVLQDLNDDSTVDKFIYLMICAVGARIVSEQENEASTSTDDAPENHTIFYINALSLNIFAFKHIKNIHALLLLVIYLLRTPVGVTIWCLIRFAMGSCIDLDLHRRDMKLFEQDPVSYQLRARTFWTAYSLERVISNSFGRPYSISDIDIDVDLPIDNGDDTNPNYIKTIFYIEHPELNYSNFDTSNFPVNARNNTYLTMSNHFFKLRRIDSQIQSTIYRVDNQTNEIPYTEISNLQVKMRNWIQELPENISTFESDYCLYLFNKQICSLTKPFLTRLDSKDVLFTETIRSCFDICLLSRRIHQSSKYQQSFISLQTAFLAGVTIVYGLLSGKISWGFEVSEGLRNCSSVLYLFAERSSNAAKFRDLFEALVFEVDEMRYSNSQQSFPKKDDGFNDSHDLFGKDSLKKRLQESHKRQNLKLFERVSKVNSLENVTDPINEMFELENLDDLFENLWKLDDIIGTEGQILGHF